MSDGITQEEILALARAWYLALDQHVPVEVCYTMIADQGLRMDFPDGAIHDRATFKQWYDRVTNLFFDENHNVQSVDLKSTDGNTATARVVVGWQASWFEPPAAKSKRTSMNAHQDWTVQRSDKNPCGLEIVYYNATAEPFEYTPGFAVL